MIAIIACVGKNGELGNCNKLCFHIKEDMDFFRRKTIGKAVIMGRKTYESIGHPLKGRTNYVLTSDPDSLMAGAIQCTNIDSFLSNYGEDVFVIGGASVYAKALPYADVLYLTEVDASADADVFFPKFDKAKYNKTVIKSGDGFEITEYVRKK